MKPGGYRLSHAAGLRRIVLACLSVCAGLGCHATPLRPAPGTHVAENDRSVPAALAPEPVSETGRPDAAPALYHQVRPGEKLSDIAALYGMTAPRLLQVNRLDDGAPLKPGQLIYIPPGR